LPLPAKVQLWVKQHPGLAIGGAVGTAAIVALLASAWPIWNNIIKPRLMKKKAAQRANGRHFHAKRDFDEEVLDEFLDDPEFLEFLAAFAEDAE
jgi:hypothetical protein